jgi:endonuclease/exonuclease/phosphatase (EEP) superfamily protein YafD
LANYAWPFELASHFQVQFVVVLTATAVLFALGRRIAWGTLAMLAALAATYVHLLPLYLSPPRAIGREVDSLATPLRIVSANIAFFNRRQSLLTDFVKQHEPDVLLLYEVSPAWLTTLNDLTELLPYHKIEPREGHPGLALLSRLPLAEIRIETVGQLPSPIVVARLQLSDAGATLTIVGAHPDPPISPRSTENRNDQIARLADAVNEQSRPLVLMGDFNCSSWNPAFQQLLHDTNLRDSRLGFGVAASWPTKFPALRVPIDHGLVSDEVIVLNRQLGTAIGSDHYPLVIDLVLPSQRSVD